MITGVFQIDAIPKYFELLKEVLPQATTFGYLVNETNPIHAREGRKVLNYAGRRLGINVEIIGVKEPSELADAFDRMSARGVAGVAINPDPVLGSKAKMTAELAQKRRLPTVGDDPSFLFAFANDYQVNGKALRKLCGPNLEGKGLRRFGDGPRKGVQALS